MSFLEIREDYFTSSNLSIKRAQEPIQSKSGDADKTSRKTNGVVKKASLDKTTPQSILPLTGREVSTVLVTDPKGSLVMVKDGGLSEKYVCYNGVLYGALKEVNYIDRGFILEGKNYINPRKASAPLRLNGKGHEGLRSPLQRK